MVNSVETSLLKKFRLKAIFKPTSITLPSSTKYKTVLIDTFDQKSGLFEKRNAFFGPKMYSDATAHTSFGK